MAPPGPRAPHPRCLRLQAGSLSVWTPPWMPPGALYAFDSRPCHRHCRLHKETLFIGIFKNNILILTNVLIYPLNLEAHEHFFLMTSPEKSLAFVWEPKKKTN